MAIAFPRAIPPELVVAGLEFLPDPMIEVTPLRSGEQLSINLGPTLWRGRWQSVDLEEDALGVVRAWYDTLLSAQVFYGWDRLREYPYAYRDGWGDLEFDGLPFDGTALLVDVAGNAVEVELDDLPGGFALSPGDYLSFDYGAGASKRALHRVSAAATAAQSGGPLTVEVRPPVRVGWEFSSPGGARVVSLYRAAAKMLILPGTYSEQLRAPALGRVSFEAIQAL